MVKYIYGDEYMNDKDFFKGIVYDKKLTEEQAKLIESQIRKFLSIQKLKLDNIQYQLYLDDNRNVYFTKDTLLYGIKYSKELVKEISSRGILANEFKGYKKEDKNYYCVNFKKIIQDVYVKKLSKEFTSDIHFPFDGINDNIAFIINPSSRIGGLLYYDLLDDKFDERLDIKNIIDYHQKKDNLTDSALLVGVPSNCISGIILGDKLILDDTIVKQIEKLFPLAYIISNKIVVEDFDKIALLSCQNNIKLNIFKSENHNLSIENEKLKKDFLNLINAIKKSTSYYNQAKIFQDFGLTIPKGLKNKLSKEELKSLKLQ